MSFKYKTIMIVDDDAIDNYLVNVLIKTNNIAETILEFDNGEKAIEYLHNNKNNHDNLPEIILLDIYMPRMNGIEFIDKLDELDIKCGKKCKICVVSSSINDNDILRTKLNANVFKYTTKPITPEFLLSL
ncbi:response regulator [Polaribacter gangjinensis]|uniref:Response regulatory domain-containing protein n=1 Tax=Polaribacter gangjinensis TaxID=574710 RepID=A0A2S7WB86_9FLAO|nr:response regulator [Polaribacter gangjinensis]PQJ74895.1 hypothetical protein BTO13_06385 [Polaribacter gangjinensis]